MLAIVNCNSGVKQKSHITGRCALFNVKLHFFNCFINLHLKLIAKMQVNEPWLGRENKLANGMCFALT